MTIVQQLHINHQEIIPIQLSFPIIWPEKFLSVCFFSSFIKDCLRL